MNLQDVNLEPLVAKAIMDSLTPEAREGLITKAVQELLTKNTGTAYEKKTTIQDAFNGAVRDAAYKMAREQLVADEEFSAKIKALFAEATERAFTGEGREKLLEAVANRMAQALSGERY